MAVNEPQTATVTTGYITRDDLMGLLLHRSLVILVSFLVMIGWCLTALLALYVDRTYALWTFIVMGLVTNCYCVFAVAMSFRTRR